MDAFAWEVIGSVAGVIAAAAAIFFGVIPLWQDRRSARHADSEPAEPNALTGKRERVEGLVSARQPGEPVIVGEIPQTPPAFQPRGDLMSALAARGPGTVLVYALTGMRGVGKTQIAAAYARSRINGKSRLVSWINAAGPAGLLNGLAETAARLGVGEPGGSVESAGKAVRHWLEAGGEGCLVVFDNVTELDELAPYVPVAGGSQIILTSNNVDAASFGSALPVDVFTAEEGLTFLADRTGLHDEQGAREIGTELGWLPLAMAQAGAVIATQHLDYAAYLARLRANPARKYLGRVKGEPYPHGTADAITLALEAVADTDPAGLCVPLLDMVALLSAAGVSRELLAVAETGLGQDKGRRFVPAEDIDSALGQLARVSLISFSIDNTMVVAHRLTMRIVTERLVASGELPSRAAEVMDLLQAATESLDQPWQNRFAARDTVQQITALHDHVNPYIVEHNADLARKLLQLSQWALWCLDDLADSFEQAIDLGQVVVAECERLLGESHPDTLSVRNNLAGAYRDAGQLGDAVPLFERVLADRERVLGASHSDTLASRNNVAYAYRLAGRHRDAILLFERTLADCERVLGEAHPRTLRSRNYLAGAYRSAGRLREAVPLLERTLADRERVLGESHPRTLRARNALAEAYEAAGRSAKAKATRTIASTPP